MGNTLKEVTGKSVEDLVKEYEAVAKDIDIWHDMLEVRASDHPDTNAAKQAAFVVSMMREVEFASDRYLDLVDLYNHLMKIKKAA